MRKGWLTTWLGWRWDTSPLAGPPPIGATRWPLPAPGLYLCRPEAAQRPTELHWGRSKINGLVHLGVLLKSPRGAAVSSDAPYLPIFTLEHLSVWLLQTNGIFASRLSLFLLVLACSFSLPTSFFLWRGLELMIVSFTDTLDTDTFLAFRYPPRFSRFLNYYPFYE